jgi:hypothetical protein
LKERCWSNEALEEDETLADSFVGFAGALVRFLVMVEIFVDAIELLNEQPRFDGETAVEPHVVNEDVHDVQIFGQPGWSARSTRR